MKNYICAICGNEYDNVADRAECETKCLAEEKKKAELIKLKKQAEEREASEKMAIEALEIAEEAVKKHLNEYEYLHLDKNYTYLKLLFSNKTWWF